MSREVIFQLLHGEVIRLLENWGYRRLALDIERRGQSHEVYHHLDRALSMYYSEYGGVNCRWLREALVRDWKRVTEVLLPNILRHYVNATTQYQRTSEIKREALR